MLATPNSFAVGRAIMAPRTQYNLIIHNVCERLFFLKWRLRMFVRRVCRTQEFRARIVISRDGLNQSCGLCLVLNDVAFVHIEQTYAVILYS